MLLICVIWTFYISAFTSNITQFEIFSPLTTFSSKQPHIHTLIDIMNLPITLKLFFPHCHPVLD